MCARPSGLFAYTLTLASVCGVVNPVVSGSAPVPVAANVTEAAFGTMPDGTPVRLFTLTNAAGMEVRATTYGVILVSIRVPDRQGQLDDIVIGHDNLEGYLTKSRYFGAVVGRYGNRIAGGRVEIDGTDVSAHAEQRPQSPARRREGLRQDGVERRDRERPARAVGGLHAHEPRRPRRLSGHACRADRVHRDGPERAHHRVLGDDRQADGPQHHAAQLLQPRRATDRATCSATA